MSTASLAREIREIKERLDLSDLISEQEAANLVGLKLPTFRKRVYGKKLEGCYIVNVLGRRNFYKSKLLGLDIK